MASDVSGTRIFHHRGNCPVRAEFFLVEEGSGAPAQGISWPRGTLVAGHIDDEPVSMRLHLGDDGLGLTLHAGAGQVIDHAEPKDRVIGQAKLFVNRYGVPKLRVQLNKLQSVFWLEVDFNAPKPLLERMGVDLEDMVQKKAAYLLSKF